jgi:uncharacterized protein (DUF302 family)
MKYFWIAAAMALAGTAQAQQAITFETDQSFDDVIFGLESAILDHGLVIDSVSHTGEMLERTKGDVGSDVTLFTQADIYSFCSASVSRSVMEADPMNIVFCPYDNFVMVPPDRPDVTVVGFRDYPDGPMDEVEALLTSIAKSALGEE